MIVPDEAAHDGALSLPNQIERRPVDRGVVNELKADMLREVDGRVTVPVEAVEAAAEYLPHSSACEARPERDCTCWQLRVNLMRNVNITDFLEARIAEDEASAEKAIVSMHGERHDTPYSYGDYVLGSERDSTVEQDEFILRWWPARVLAECAAKRVIIKDHLEFVYAIESLSAALPGNLNQEPDAPWRTAPYRNLAAVYSDHPDYQQDWAL